MRCPVCGFDPAALSPTDAVAALRSFTRRYAALLEPDEGIDAAPQPAPDSARPHVLAAAEAAARDIDAAGEDLRRVLVTDEPVVTSTGELSVAGSGPEGALDDLHRAAYRVADLAAGTHGRDWTRSGRRDGRAITAMAVLAEAVHSGAHHLRDATRAAGRDR